MRGVQGLSPLGAAGIPPNSDNQKGKEMIEDKTMPGELIGAILSEKPWPPTERTEGRKQFLHYMFTTALEGGIGYWSCAAEYHWSKNEPGVASGPEQKRLEEDLDGFYAILESSDDDWGVQEAFVSETGEVQAITETQSLRVDIAVIERGWNLFVDKVIAATKSEDPKADFSRPYFRQAIVQWLTDMEDGDSDADVADLVVQLGLFGEVVYS